MNIPPCEGYRDAKGDFDCLYGVDWDCEYCLCNWHTTGGTCNPVTGMHHKYDTCVRRFGEPAFIGNNKQEEK